MFVFLVKGLLIFDLLVRGFCINKRYVFISYKVDLECEGVFSRNVGRKKVKC